ncbi:hypothetical protein V8E51_012456 [Hyaloscypha variabilis]
MHLIWKRKFRSLVHPRKCLYLSSLIFFHVCELAAQLFFNLFVLAGHERFLLASSRYILSHLGFLDCRYGHNLGHLVTTRPDPNRSPLRRYA